jgi:antitoxin (DNA-binding transcriptional repressor) of toxin-antitoxin stability system
VVRRKRPYRIEYAREAVSHLDRMDARKVAPWELRIRDIRVYFDVADDPEPIVTVRAIGMKVREKVVITVRGKAVAALTAIGTNTDLENLLVGNDPRFRALIERSRARNPPGTGLSTAEVRRRLRQRRSHRSGRAGSSAKRTTAIARRRRAVRP